MKDSIEQSMTWTLAYEGGYVNHKDDPGGPTNKGITQRVYDAFRVNEGLKPHSVRLITSDEVAAIYKRQYWDACRADELPVGLDFCVWDFSVHSGVSRAVKELQKLIGERADGIVGVKTLAAVARMDVVELIVAYCNARLAFCSRLKNWKSFRVGWTRRIIGDTPGAQENDYGVVDRAIALLSRDKDILASIPEPVAGKAESADRESIGESNTMRASAMDIGMKLLGGGLVIPQLSPEVQIVASAGLVVVVLLSVWIMRERLASWAAGWR